MKSQVVSSESTLNRALKLNQELEGLRGDNFKLQDENENLSAKNESLVTEREGFIQLVQDLKKELDGLKASAASKEKKLIGELKGLQASWESLYNDHSAAEKSRAEEQQQNSNTPNNTEENGEESISSSSSSDDDESQTARPKQQDDVINQQAELLLKAVKKQSTSPSNMVSPMERKLHELEDENKTLKSVVVRLQTQYKEEKYKNEHREDAKLDFTVSIESGSSIDDSAASAPAPASGGFFGFSKRTQNIRPSESSTPTCSPATTKSLWGRMSSGRNLQTQTENQSINLAYSRENNSSYD